MIQLSNVINLRQAQKAISICVTKQMCETTLVHTPSSVYKELAYKDFFWPVLKVLAELRKLSTESLCGKEFSKI